MRVLNPDVHNGYTNAIMLNPVEHTAKWASNDLSREANPRDITPEQIKESMRPGWADGLCLLLLFYTMISVETCVRISERC